RIDSPGYGVLGLVSLWYLVNYRKVKDWMTSRNAIRRIHEIGYAVSRIWEDILDKIELTFRVVSREALLFIAKSLG
ncbi:hypothetical protein Tco_0864904, partial [Tanacetum coccineum]